MSRASVSLAETLYANLRESILAGDFDPGEPLDEVEVARSMGTSRTPAREALRKLEAEGLVEKVPHRGTFVARLSPAEVDDIREVRALLEGFAARRAAKLMSRVVLDRIRGEIERLSTEGPTGDNPRTALQLDRQVHRVIAEASGNQQIASLVDQLTARLHGMRLVPTAERFWRILDEHGKLADALSAADPDAAEAAMLQHLGAATSNIESLLRQEPTLIRSHR